MSERPDALDRAITDMLDTLQSAGIWVGADRTGSIVTLTGTVDSGADRDAVLDVARATVTRAGGRVINDLEIPDIEAELLMAEEVAGEQRGWEQDPGEEPRDPDSTLPETNPDFTDDLGSTDPMLAASEAMPWFPPTDPVVGPAEDARGLKVLNGFAPTGDEPEWRLNEPAPDDLLARRVLRALADDALTTDLLIGVLARQGVVYLRGDVPTLDDAENAEAVAAGIEGVVEVRESLRVGSLHDRP